MVTDAEIGSSIFFSHNVDHILTETAMVHTCFLRLPLPTGLPAARAGVPGSWLAALRLLLEGASLGPLPEGSPKLPSWAACAAVFTDVRHTS